MSPNSPVPSTTSFRCLDYKNLANIIIIIIIKTDVVSWFMCFFIYTLFLFFSFLSVYIVWGWSWFNKMKSWSLCLFAYYFYYLFNFKKAKNSIFVSIMVHDSWFMIHDSFHNLTSDDSPLSPLLPRPTKFTQKISPFVQNLQLLEDTSY